MARELVFSVPVRVRENGDRGVIGEEKETGAQSVLLLVVTVEREPREA